MPVGLNPVRCVLDRWGRTGIVRNGPADSPGAARAWFLTGWTTSRIRSCGTADGCNDAIGVRSWAVSDLFTRQPRSTLNEQHQIYLKQLSPRHTEERVLGAHGERHIKFELGLVLAGKIEREKREAIKRMNRLLDTSPAFGNPARSGRISDRGIRIADFKSESLRLEMINTPLSAFF